jgi:hypothetical protein
MQVELEKEKEYLIFDIILEVLRLIRQCCLACPAILSGGPGGTGIGEGMYIHIYIYIYIYIYIFFF